MIASQVSGAYLRTLLIIPRRAYWCTQSGAPVGYSRNNMQLPGPQSGALSMYVHKSGSQDAGKVLL